MVFENLTLFEIQLDRSQFGPRSIGGSDDADEEFAEESEEGGRGRFLPVFMFALVAVGMAALYRRSRSGDAEFDIESEDIEADLTSPE